MAVASNGRFVALSLALVAACGAALFYAVYMQRAPQPDVAAVRDAPAATAVSPAPAAAPSAPATQDVASALATAKATANAALSDLAVSPPAPVDEGGPAFDIARIENSGEAVIAGRAAPGAVVELLRDGQPHDHATVDPSGQFVMVPPPLPPGKYELTLRATAPDGQVTTSRHSVAVALNEMPTPSAASARAKVPAVNQVATAAPLVETHAAVAVSDAATAERDQAAVGATGAIPRTASRVVSRGDSLWRISRVTYGDGARYSLIFRANRAHIHDPNRIYPGQTFVLPVR